MRAFKAFNKNMTCTLGHGSYQYEEGKTYREDKAQAHETGFHCASYILDCFSYYPKSSSTIVCPVEASGDIDEDGSNTKISCTVMTIGKRMSCEGIVLEAIRYIARHPRFKDKHIHENKGRDDYFCIVRGTNPIAAGSKGTVLGIIKENPRHKIQAVAIYKIDGIILKAGHYYDINGEEVQNEEG